VNTATHPPIQTQRVVLLNASYELLAVVDVPRAVGYLIVGKAEMVAPRPDVTLRSAGGFQMPCPAVVRLIRYVRLPVRSLVPAWTRRGLFQRDGHRCAYCGDRGITVDHLLPVSRGGRSTWMNTVAACIRCNQRKADRTPAEAAMPLRWGPTEPTVRTALLFGLGATERAVLAELGLVDVA